MEATIKRVKVDAYMNTAYCPDCDVELEDTGILLPGLPPKHQYACPKCGVCFNLSVAYPTVTYQYTGEEV